MARNEKVKSAIVDLRAKLNKKRGNQKQNKFIGCHFCETKTVNIDHEQLRKGTDSDAVHIERTIESFGQNAVREYTEYTAIQENRQ